MIASTVDSFIDLNHSICRESLHDQGFVEINTPKIIAGTPPLICLSFQCCRCRHCSPFSLSALIIDLLSSSSLSSLSSQNNGRHSTLATVHVYLSMSDSNAPDVCVCVCVCACVRLRSTSSYCLLNSILICNSPFFLSLSP